VLFAEGAAVAAQFTPSASSLKAASSTDCPSACDPPQPDSAMTPSRIPSATARRQEVRRPPSTTASLCTGCSYLLLYGTTRTCAIQAAPLRRALAAAPGRAVASVGDELGAGREASLVRATKSTSA